MGTSTVVGALPARTRSILGRERELELLADLLAPGGPRLITLTGPGGVGKTRLAVEAASVYETRSGAEVFFVDLAPLAEAELVLPSIAAALHVTGAIDRPLEDRLIDRLRARPALLLLDNFEHLLDAAPAVGDLLAAGEEVRVLATSREPLRLTWEQEVPIAPLRLPESDAAATAEQLLESPAVALFVARARAADPGFTLHGESAPSVAEICRRLDGLPLALELAAARTRSLPARAMLDRLDRVLDVVAGGPRDAPTRHRTLRAAIDWSYALLEPELRSLLRRLSVFAGGADLEAVEALIERGSEPGSTGLDRCHSLVERSLLVIEADSDGEARFRLLETIRGFAAERLGEAGETADARRLHAEHYRRLAERAERELEGGVDQRRWLDRCDREIDNFRAALQWADEQDEPELGVSLAAALHWFWFVRAHWSEGRHWLDRLLAPGREMRASTRGRGLVTLGLLSIFLDDYAGGVAHLSSSLANAEEAGDQKTAALARNWLALYDASRRGDVDRAVSLGETSLATFRRLGDRVNVARTLTYLARDWIGAGAPERAREAAVEAVEAFRASGYLGGTAYGLGALAYARLAAGDLPGARAAANEGLELARHVDYPWAEQYALQALGEVARAEGAAVESGKHLREALALLNEHGNRWHLVRTLEVLAGVAADLGQPQRAARLLGGADRLREVVGEAVPPGIAERRSRDIAVMRRRLGNERYGAAHAAGAALADRELIAEAGQVGLAAGREHAATSRRHEALPSARSPISARERRVADLVAEGLGNREIAEELGITEATAEAHVRHIFNKLGINRRSQIAAWVARQDPSTS